jgi:D-tyrosyl-tRNA(Tyr) deacylase
VFDKLVSNVQEVKARKGKVIGLTTRDEPALKGLLDYEFRMPSTMDMLTPVLAAVPLQLLAYYIAVKRGADVDQPRNLAKSVTVECGLRTLLQRVTRAEVRVGDRVTGRIERGFLLLVGFRGTDDEATLAWMAEKVAGLRLFADDEGKMNLSLEDVGGALLVVSQFTLYGDARKGRRPSFIDAAPPEIAIPLYERFVALLRDRGFTVGTGEFGAMMDVELVNDGPVTLWLER